MEGLAPIIIQELMVAVRKLIADAGTTVIIVEQHAKLALSVTEQVIVLDRGRVVHRSDSGSLLRSLDHLHKLITVPTNA
jgi:branched-chain amino acid transport system ATP-binding protein